MNLFALRLALAPETVALIHWIAGAFAASALLFGIFAMFFTGWMIYTKVLRREKNWGSDPVIDSAEQREMDAIGQAWRAAHADRCQPVEIERDGLHFHGEYYDLGFKDAVMVLSGRTESRRYGYYFAKPYEESGYNLLVVDPRAHGESDGTYNTLGREESLDTLCWVRMLRERFGVRSVVFHGICIGSANGLYALLNEQCPDYVRGMVAEGMFPRFYESMRNHLIERNRPTFPTLWFIDFWGKHFTGHTITRGPIDCIHAYTKPLLMLHSKEDTYSTPQFAQKLYDLCGSENKQLEWFPKGGHSLLRITDTAHYDTAIKTFLANLPSLD